MQTLAHATIFVLAAVVLLDEPRTADAVCCWPANGCCANSDVGTPYCGKGACNLFGCDCEGGCHRGGKRSVKGVSEMENAQKIMSEADLNGDGVLTVEELAAFLKKDKPLIAYNNRKQCDQTDPEKVAWLHGRVKKE